MNRKLVALLLALVLVLPAALVPAALTSSASFASPIVVSVDGELRSEPTQVFDTRTYITIDGLRSYGLEPSVRDGVITLKNENVRFVFELGANRVTVNDVAVTLDARPYEDGGAIYVPYRFVLNTLGFDVDYDAAKKQVVVTSAPQPKFPVVIRDGELSYTFDKEVQRVVSLAPSVTEVLFAIGAGDKVVGRTDYCIYPAKTAELPSVGTLYQPNLEKIVDLRPDAVIAASHMNEDVLKVLSGAGIATATNKTPQKIDGVYDFIASMGAITGKFYESRALISSMQAKSSRVDYVMSTVPLDQRRSVYYVVGTGEYGEFTAGKNTFADEMLTKAGTVNVAQDAEGWSYSLEKLIDHDPEYLIGGSFAFDTMKAGKNYAALSALRNGRFLVIDDTIFSVPGPRIFDYSIKTLILRLYPTKAGMLHF